MGQRPEGWPSELPSTAGLRTDQVGQAKPKSRKRGPCIGRCQHWLVGSGCRSKADTRWMEAWGPGRPGRSVLTVCYLVRRGLKQKRLSQLSDAHQQLSWPSVWTHINYWRSGKNLTAHALDRTGSWPGDGSSSMDSRRAEAEVSETQSRNMCVQLITAAGGTPKRWRASQARMLTQGGSA